MAGNTFDPVKGWTVDPLPDGLIRYDPTDGLVAPSGVVVPGQLTAAEAATVRARPRGAASLAGQTSWWPLNEGTGTTVTDAINGGLTGTIQGTTTGVWANGAAEGVVFNGTDVQIAINPSPASNLLRDILNLSTLNGVDQMIIWFVITHPTTIASGGVMTWGLEGTAGANAAYEGFSIALLSSNSWFQWRDRPPGATTFTQTGLTNPSNVPSLAGSGGGNTKSAVCLSIEYNPTMGYYEIVAARASITQAGAISQTDGGIYTVTALPNSATGRTRFNTAAGLTFGAVAKTAQVVTGDYSVRIPAAHALRNIGLQRRNTAYGGIAMRIARDLAKAPTAFPASARVY